jgi:MoaA/NifB/PqqE/SkfB family radical SAM enzyme
LSEYVSKEICAELPRLPLEGFIDLTYRCNNNCRHCWLWTPDTAAEAAQELTFDEIRRIADEARAMGCRSWAISGGEPMLRADFEEIFEYLTRKGAYTLNTNGALITPRIAELMKRPGLKMIALYGATADVHDHITRTPGSFDAFMKGCSLLKEAGTSFMVQVIPMRDNRRQFEEMMILAEKLSPEVRIGAAWLYLSACGDPDRNSEIRRQRLAPEDILQLDKPDIAYEEVTAGNPACPGCATATDDRLFASCVTSRRDFHIDPFGRASFCNFIKDPALRFDLKKGSFSEFWESFLPSLADKVRGGAEYINNCGACEIRKGCRWCGVYGYLEHGRFSAKVDYLCALAGEHRKYEEQWKREHRRYYRNAGITIQIDSDIPIGPHTFDKAVSKFEVGEPGDDIVTIRHHFSLSDMDKKDLGQPVYDRPPWTIYQKGDSWIYVGSSQEPDAAAHQISVFNADHSRGRIYNSSDHYFREGGLNSLCLYPTDQILMARIVVSRSAFYLHSAGIIYHKQGLLFVGHSEAGKSTTVKIFKDKAVILCDDRNILRKQEGRWHVYGTWSHGEIPDVSPESAPLKAIFFLEKSDENNLLPLRDREEILLKLVACLIRPFADAGWWGNILPLVEDVCRNVPCFRMLFDKSGDIVPFIDKIVTDDSEAGPGNLD